MKPTKEEIKRFLGPQCCDILDFLINGEPEDRARFFAQLDEIKKTASMTADELITCANSLSSFANGLSGIVREECNKCNE